MPKKNESFKPFKLAPNSVSTAIINRMMKELDHQPIEAVLDAMVIMPIMIATTFSNANAEELTALIAENWDHINKNCVMLNVEGTDLDDEPSEKFDPSKGEMKKLDGQTIHELTNPILEHYDFKASPTAARDLSIKLTGVPAIICTKMGISKEVGLQMMALNWEMYAEYTRNNLSMPSKPKETKK